MKLLQLTGDQAGLATFFSAFASSRDHEYLSTFLADGSPWRSYADTAIVLEDAPTPRIGILVDDNPRHEQRVATFHDLVFAIGDVDQRLVLAKQLFDALCPRLAADGFERIEGPFSFNSWHNRYRVYQDLDRGSSIPGENCEPPEMNAIYAQSLAVCKRYSSRLTIVGGEGDGPLPCEQHGIRLELLFGADYLRHAQTLFRIAQIGFAGNFRYSVAELDEYMAILPFLTDPNKLDSNVVLAWHGETLVGFLSSYGYQQPSGDKCIVYKSAAVLPEFRRRRIGGSMTVFVEHWAKPNGYSRAIYATMMDDNVGSQRAASSTGSDTLLRRYLLYGRDL